MMSKKVEEVKEKEEVVKEKKARTKKVKEAEPKEEIKEEKVKKTRTKKTKVEEPKEEVKEEIVEAEKVVIKEEEKAEAIEMVENTTTLALFNNDEVEILKKMIVEYRLKNSNNTRSNGNTTNDNTKEFFENIDIPNEVRKIEYNTTLSIRGKQEIYDKIKEVAKKNGITASLLVNYLFYLILKPLGKWEEATKK